MKLEAMVTDSQFEDLLEALRGDELSSICRAMNCDGQKIPMVTASVSTARLLGFVQKTNATPSREQYRFPDTSDALFIDGVSQAGDFPVDNMVGTIGIWRHWNEERL